MAILSEDAYLQRAVDSAAMNTAASIAEAALNRKWETEMSNTAHQREVRDLAAAGLNPILSSNSGASWAGVPNATVDTGNTSAYSSMATTKMNNAAMVQAASISAAAQVAAASLSAAAVRYSSDQTYQYQSEANAIKLLSNPYALLSVYGADLHGSGYGQYSWNDMPTAWYASDFLRNSYSK